MFVRLLTAGALALAAVSPVKAQDTLVSSDMDYYVQTADGKPAICGKDYTLVFQDRTYQSGRLSAVRATMAFSQVSGNPLLLLKVTGVEFDSSTKATGYRVNAASLYSRSIGQMGQIGVPKVVPCVEAISYCTVYSGPDVAKIDMASSPKPDDLMLRFNKSPGALDVELPLETNKFLLAKAADARAYATCELAILLDSNNAAPK
jgi:hypothetical protein